MKRALTRHAALLLAVLVAACSTPDAAVSVDAVNADSARVESAILEATSTVDVEVGRPKVFAPEGAERNGPMLDVAADVTPAAVTLPMIYHNGQIMPSPKVVTIYWHSSQPYLNTPNPGTTGPGTNDASLIGFFLRNLGGSAWWNINTAYFDVGTGSVRHVPAAIPYARYWAANLLVPTPNSSVSDSRIRDLIKTGIILGKIPFDDDAIYTVFSASGINLGGKFGITGGYCAYHSWFAFTYAGQKHYLKYAVMPRAADFVTCRGLNQTLSINGAYAADVEVNGLAHELAEAVTDPYISAWYDVNGDENADKCAWTYGTTYTTPTGAKANIVLGGKNFLIQRNWSLGTAGIQKGCSMRP